MLTVALADEQVFSRFEKLSKNWLGLLSFVGALVGLR